jgi:AbrB family looped-hinge helix DNA binding protein
MTRKLETARVKRKGRVTIPERVRHKYEIEEGDLLTIDTKNPSSIILKVKRLPEIGRRSDLKNKKEDPGRF